ncbi:MAG: hypothetical protein K8R02_09285 [Anaerohalosphaeraceae bacterium]|nr:hypothetical protein [Anaerohalosphaeraceae bacterium]
MKKFAILFSVTIGMLVLAVGVANAADGDVLVNTTFEVDSAGPMTWDNDEYGVRWGRQTSEPYSGAVDPCSGVEWIRNATYPQFGPSDTTISGDQCGWLRGRSSGAKYSKLEFGTLGDYNDVYTMTWLQYNASQSEVSGSRSSFVWIIDKSDPYNEAVKVIMSEDLHAIVVSYGGGTATLMSGMLDRVWYEFEMVLDFQAKEFDVRVKEAGNSFWQGTLDDLDFVDANCVSFDRIYCEASKDTVYGYFDDIKVVEGLPTYECGDWGYAKGDLNEDCYVDFEDMAILAENWLACTDPYNNECF